jgi:hypothetical protein
MGRNNLGVLYESLCTFALGKKNVYRFPIPDLRPIHDMARPPWWRRSVRKDFLVLELSDASFHSLIDSQEPCRRFEVQCRDINGLFQVSFRVSVVGK